MNKSIKSAWIWVAILGILGVFLLALSLIPFEADIIAGKTTVVFDKTELELGMIKFNDPQKAEFGFTNTGENRLIIYDVQPSCGCTNVDWTKEPLKTGESGKIGVVYDAGTTGRFVKSIVVHCNGQIERIVLQISGEVIEEE